jgi:hypothetical protein
MKKEPRLPKDGKWSCMFTDNNLHYCEIDSPYHCYGPALADCHEDLDGCLYIGNGEYGSQVNFCPKCGFKANKPIDNS